MDEASVARRRRWPKRLRVLHTDEWVALERTVNLLALAFEGLAARGRAFLVDAHRDITPLVTLVDDFHEALDKFERKVVQATLPLPTQPAELTDPDRVVSA